MLPNRFAHVELVELNMVDSDVILIMNWFHDCFASTNCKTRIVKFNFLNELFFMWKDGNSIPRGRIISSLKACKIFSNGCLYHIIRVKDLDSTKSFY